MGFHQSPRYGDVVNCRGLNHQDEGRGGHCDDCGGLVVQVRKPGKNPYMVDAAHGEGGYGLRYFCFNKPHVCDPEHVARYDQAKQVDRDNGKILKGDTVEVFKGRKVPKGTVGIVRWQGTDSYDTEKVGLAVEGEEKLVYTALSNVRLTEGSDQ